MVLFTKIIYFQTDDRSSGIKNFQSLENFKIETSIDFPIIRQRKNVLTPFHRDQKLKRAKSCWKCEVSVSEYEREIEMS